MKIFNKLLIKLINLMLLVISILIIFLGVSCRKNTITPGNYIAKPELKDTTRWQTNYTNGGVIPTTNLSTTPNEFVNTKWVLTYLQIGFSTPPLPVDTVFFIDNNHYTINSGSYRTYQLYSGVTLSSKTLLLNYHYPFGSGNYSGQVASTFVTDGVILNTEFVNTNSLTIKVKASFLKI